MKVITWNLGYCWLPRFHDEAWDYLRQVVQPDLALLQEVRAPSLTDDEAVVFAEIHQGWGTAIYSRCSPLEQIPLCTDYPNRVVGAIAALDHGEQLYLASIHAPIIDDEVFPHLSRMMDEIEESFTERRAIVGGDLNAARLAEQVWPGHGHGPFFERMERSELRDCCQRINGKELQTFYRNGAVHPFQDDHLFISRDLLEGLKTCDVLNTPVTRRVSDHIPLFIELAL